MSTDHHRLQKYIQLQIENEQALSSNQSYPMQDGRLHRVSRFVILKYKEFYWTVTKLAGLGHLHDGSINNSLTAYSAALQKLSHALGSEFSATPAGQRLFIDVTQTLLSERVSGIQRVSLEVCRAALHKGGIPVFAFEDKLYAAQGPHAKVLPLEIAKGDKYILTGAWWATPVPIHRIMQDISARGGHTTLILFDLFPLLYTNICQNVENFVAWFDRIVLGADAIVCISRSVADEFVALMREQCRPFKPDLQLGWQELGADFSTTAIGTPSRETLALCDVAGPLFLSVSTLEPRKGYPIALDAFDKLWQEGSEARYVIVGREGWMVAALKKRILSHPEYGRRLFWFGNAGDADLRHLYQHAHALIFPTIAEGFGLALAEAAHYGLPAIVSDIPVFREIAGDAAIYFDVADSDMLTQRIREALDTPKAPPAIHVPSWREATDSLLMRIETDDYQYGRLQDRLSATE